jgi:flavodoxin
MNVGIVVYSKTGNSLSVAEKVKKDLERKGFSVTMLAIEASGEGPNTKLISAPDISSYDTLVFASPVQAFSLALPMKSYLENMASLKDKKVFCFVTQHLKKAWMGGNHAVKQIKEECIKKEGSISYSGVINWSSSKREDQINEIVKTISSRL